jgi:hypothetical protein
LRTVEKIQKVGMIIQAKLKTSEKSALWYTNKMTTKMPQIIAGYRETTTSDQFRKLAVTRWNLTEEQAHKLADIWTAGRGTDADPRPSVSMAQKRLEELTKEAAAIPVARTSAESQLKINMTIEAARLAEESMKREEEAAAKRAASKKK